MYITFLLCLIAALLIHHMSDKLPISL